jgi:hypothetical protein
LIDSALSGFILGLPSEKYWKKSSKSPPADRPGAAAQMTQVSASACCMLGFPEPACYSFTRNLPDIGLMVPKTYP